MGTNVDKLTINQLSTLYPKLPSGKLKNAVRRTLAAKQHAADLVALRSALKTWVTNRLSWPNGIEDFVVEEDRLIVLARPPA